MSGFLGQVWPILTPSLGYVGQFWPILGRFGGFLQGLLDNFRSICGRPPWSHLEPSWAIFGTSWACLGLSWTILSLSCACLGLSWACPGLSWPPWNPTEPPESHGEASWKRLVWPMAVWPLGQCLKTRPIFRVYQFQTQTKDPDWLGARGPKTSPAKHTILIEPTKKKLEASILGGHRPGHQDPAIGENTDRDTGTLPLAGTPSELEFELELEM